LNNPAKNIRETNSNILLTAVTENFLDDITEFKGENGVALDGTTFIKEKLAEYFK